MSEVPSAKPLPALSEALRSEAAAWLATHRSEIPAAVAETIAFGVALADRLGPAAARQRSLLGELRRALGLTPSSERRKASGKPLSGLPKDKQRLAAKERLLHQIGRSKELGAWYRDLARRHRGKVKRLNERLVKLEDIELTPEDEAEIAEEQRAYGERLELGERCDLDSAKSTEALMRGAACRLEEEAVAAAVDREGLPKGAVIKQQFFETRDRFSFSFAVTRLEVQVEKLSVQVGDQTRLVCGTLDDLGPAKMRVTWDFLANMAILVSQYAMPLNRFAALVSTEEKTFKSSETSRYFRFVASRFLPVYMHLGRSLATSDVLLGDDTSARVIEVLKGLKARATDAKAEASWDAYATAEKAQATLAGSGPASLGAKIAAVFGFESQRKDGTGAKAALNTTVLSGRVDAFDPKSTVIFYRSHMGGLGNLLDAVLRERPAAKKKLVLQTDLSTVNLISEPQLKEWLDLKLIGCAAHARRPFAIHEADDPDLCAFMLHHFKGIAIFEGGLDAIGRNRDNSHAVRDVDERAAWEEIRHGAGLLAKRWARDTPLGGGARYILRHYDKLTHYLSDHRLMPSNNFSERMLRLEKLIEAGSLFRQTLDGRFALDIMRTVLQTAIAAGIDLVAYLTWVMRMPAEVVEQAPEAFTPLAYARDVASTLH